MRGAGARGAACGAAWRGAAWRCVVRGGLGGAVCVGGLPKPCCAHARPAHAMRARAWPMRAADGQGPLRPSGPPRPAGPGEAAGPRAGPSRQHGLRCAQRVAPRPPSAHCSSSARVSRTQRWRRPGSPSQAELGAKRGWRQGSESSESQARTMG